MKFEIKIGVISLICAYCQKNKKATREHIIPSSIIDLFPELELAFRSENDYFEGEAVIKDVCSKCNNEKLSKLDKFGKNIVKDYFIKNYKKNDTIEFEYKFNFLSRWLMKLAYNSDRTYKRNVKHFRDNIDYILKNSKKINNPISIFSGLAINTSPMPGYFVMNRKLHIKKDPKMMIEPLFIQEGSQYLKCKFNNNRNPIEFENMICNYFFQFNSGLFLLFFWKNDWAKKRYDKFIEKIFPYKLIKPNSTNINLLRSTHAYNYHTPYLIDSLMGMKIADSTNTFLPPNVDPSKIKDELNIGWEDYVKKKRNQ